MTTSFSLLRNLTGLSSAQAAQFLEVSLDTVKSWNSGRNGAPDWALDDLRNLWRALERRADIGIEQLRATIQEQGFPPEQIEFGAPMTDREAREELDLPFVSCFHTFVAIFMTRTDIPIVIVPRGSTPLSKSLVEARKEVELRSKKSPRR